MNPPVSPAVAPDELRVDAPDPLYMSTLAQRPAASAGRVPRGALAAPRAVGVLTGAVAALVESWNGATPFKTAGLVVFALLAGIAVAGREPRWRRLLPLMGALSRAVAPVLSAAVLVLVHGLGGLPDLGIAAIVEVVALSTLGWLVAERVVSRVFLGRNKIRAVVIGSSRSADSLERELRLAGEHGYEVVGRVALPDTPLEAASEVPVLGSLRDLGRIVAHHDIRLLLMAGEAPRLAVFDEVARSCLGLPVRLHELSGFYEQVFGHVPVGDINTAWFQYIMHPAYRAQESLVERALDVLAALVGMVATSPLLLVLALVIRRDGGPVLFRQVRIGEGGRPFTILKLRTMHVGASPAWAEIDDERVTAIGRVLRRTHLDELPQFINVLRGEMSIVGPRPEQPAFVERLERVVPFYSRRHLIKPGVTGWAQVRCGYAGSDIGSTWKVAHDLYYLKHRSLGLYLVIIGETVRTLFAEPQYAGDPSNVAFILGSARSALDEPAQP